MRTLYRLLSLLTTGRAVSRGPSAYARNYVRRRAHRSLASTMRRAGL